MQGGTGPAGEARSVLNLTHEEIGQMIGTSRETVSRAFAKLRMQGLTGIDGPLLTFPDRSVLENLE